MSAFACSQCGACCRLVGADPSMVRYDRGDGVCKHLTPDNRCQIYETRPDTCRVDRSCPAVMTTSEWHRRNHEACARIHLHVYGQPLR